MIQIRQYVDKGKQGSRRGGPAGKIHRASTNRSANNVCPWLHNSPYITYAAQSLYRISEGVVLIHEIGHHFGFSDEDLARVEGRA